MNTRQLFAPTRTEICGIPVADLAEKFGTPTYIYDAETIRQRIEQLRQFDVIRFAQKANSNIAVLDLMRKHVVYTADIFDRESLELVVKNNIPVNCGSPDMISQLGQAAPGREITLRINPGFGHGHSAKTNTGGDHSKHGIWHEQLDECVALANENNLTVAGLHMHIGSGTDFEHLSQVCDAMRETALKVGSTITTISAGGGLPTPYKNEDKGLDVDRYFQRICSIWLMPDSTILLVRSSTVPTTQCRLRSQARLRLSFKMPSWAGRCANRATSSLRKKVALFVLENCQLPRLVIF